MKAFLAQSQDGLKKEKCVDLMPVCNAYEKYHNFLCDWKLNKIDDEDKECVE